jgi:hypothetical protein
VRNGPGVIVVPQPMTGVIHDMIEAIETRWLAATPRPTFVFARTMPPEIVDLVARDAERRHRFFGMDDTSQRPVDMLVSHYNETYSDKVTRENAPGSSFDAFYALAYAVHALGEATVTGPAIGGAFRRLVGPGRTVNVGPQSVIDAYAELVRGANIDLEGVGTHLDLDPSSGESPASIAILCASLPEPGKGARRIESGLTYDAHSHSFVGTLACP